MNFFIDRSALLLALNRLNGVVARKSTVPILSYILIDAAGQGVTLRATNGDMEATVRIVAEVNAPGITTVSADLLLNIAKNAAEGSQISFDLQDRLIIKSGRSTFKLATLPAADFPAFVELAPIASLQMTSADLEALIGRVAFAKSDDQGRYIMCSVHFFSDGEHVGAAATDTRRVAISEREEIAPVFGATIPPAMVTEMLRLAGACEILTVRVGGKIQIEGAGAVITSKLIAGDYIQFRRANAIPTPTVVVVEYAHLAQAIKRVLIAAMDTSRSMRLDFRPGLISVLAQGGTVAASDEVECYYEGEPFTIPFNGEHLLEALEAAESPVIELAFREQPNAPFIVRAPSEEGFINMVCPLGQ